jgi:hypothetical protein
MLTKNMVKFIFAISLPQIIKVNTGMHFLQGIYNSAFRLEEKTEV